MLTNSAIPYGQQIISIRMLFSYLFNSFSEVSPYLVQLSLFEALSVARSTAATSLMVSTSSTHIT